MKAIIYAALMLPGLAFANVSFETTGEGYYCYHDFAKALDSAKNSADQNAAQVCAGGSKQAVRISEYKNLGIIECSVFVQATYICK